jgi:uncharacterized protein
MPYSYDGTGLIRAAERGYDDIVRRLLETDIEIDHVNRLGWTALLEAIILGDGGRAHTRTVRLLVEAGADVNLPDWSGTTPVAHARRRDFTGLVRILRRAGARGSALTAPTDVATIRSGRTSRSRGTRRLPT